MSAIPAPTEEEMYLLAILDDPSGIELAEFCWIDDEKDDGCFRLWDFQWSWYRDESIYQIDFAGRSLGKSVGIQMRAFAFPFNFPGAEMLITAPELNHLRPVTDKIEHQILSHRLTREILPRQRGSGINHQPQFQVHFVNNSRIISRLPQRDGKGVKGMHPLVIEADEMQDFPENGWIELIETMKSGTKGAQWRCHGVSKGLRDRYYRYTMGEDADIPFRVHRYMAMHRPSWSAPERKAKIAIYGGTEDNIDYRRNIYGEHGDATNPVFVLHRLMACVRMQESPWATRYNEDVYAPIKVNDEQLTRSGLPIEALIDIPGTHLDQAYTSFWGGMDVGFTRDPSELLIFGELDHPGKDRKGESMLRLLLRLHMMRISAANQAEAIKHVIEFYGKRLRMVAMDKTGNGLPLWQELDPAAVGTPMHLRRTPEHISARIRGYNFSSKVAVDFDDRPLTRQGAPRGRRDREEHRGLRHRRAAQDGRHRPGRAALGPRAADRVAGPGDPVRPRRGFSGRSQGPALRRGVLPHARRLQDVRRRAQPGGHRGCAGHAGQAGPAPGPLRGLTGVRRTRHVTTGRRGPPAAPGQPAAGHAVLAGQQDLHQDLCHRPGRHAHRGARLRVLRVRCGDGPRWASDHPDQAGLSSNERSRARLSPVRGRPSLAEVPVVPTATMQQDPEHPGQKAEDNVRSLSLTTTPAPTAGGYMLVDPISMLGRPGHLGTRQEVQTELDVIALAMRAFHVKQPDQIMRETAAYTARLTELAVLLHRVEATDRQYTRIRTQQVEKFLAELDRQYKVASRLVEIMRQDLELSR